MYHQTVATCVLTDTWYITILLFDIALSVDYVPSVQSLDSFRSFFARLGLVSLLPLLFDLYKEVSYEQVFLHSA